MTPTGILLALLFCHFVADFPLQGDWLAKAKNHKFPPIPGETIWPISLAAHAYIHGFCVGALTGSLLLGACEFVAHAAIDWAKSDGRISYTTDQLAHVLCKAVWFTVFVIWLR